MKLVITSLVAASAALASAQFNNDVVHTRVLNGAPGSTLTVFNVFPTAVAVFETNVENTTAVPFANQTNWNLSPDGTADTTLASTDSWSLSFDLNLNSTGTAAGALGLDKEAGFWIGNSGGAGNPGQFIVKSDGELVQFGGNLPFHDFVLNGHSTGNPDNYQLGTPLRMSMSYNGTTGMMTSSVFYGNDTSSFTGAAPLVSGYTVGGYALYQVDTTGVANTGQAIFSNIVPAPEPVGMTVLGFGALALMRRRRKGR